MGVPLGTDMCQTVPACVCGDYRASRCLMGYGDGLHGMNHGVQQLPGTLNLSNHIEIGDRWPLQDDGIFRTATRTGLIRMRRFLGISANGGYGPQTAAAMKQWTTAYTAYGLFHLGYQIPGQ
jgi:hypothetical protein